MKRRSAGSARSSCCASWPCSCSSTTSRSLRADDLNTKPGNIASGRPGVQPAPRHSIARPTAPCSPGRCQSNDQFKYPARSTRRATVRPRHRLLQLPFGATGLETAYNDELSGQTAKQQLRSLSRPVRRPRPHRQPHADGPQGRAAGRTHALGNRKGSVVAIDPKTGDILAFWSYPTYDPNVLSEPRQRAPQAAKNLLEASPDKPLLPRMYRERFFPGSTFKVVTGSVGVQAGMVTQTHPVYPAVSSYTPPQTNRPLRNFGGEACGGALFDILAVSCNTAFAQMGVDLGTAPA